ncbi:MAG: hypothetical protein P8Y54_07165 [Xanthomonadales bacterium]
MSGELLFLLVILASVAVGFAALQLSKHRRRIKRSILRGLERIVEAGKRKLQEPERHIIESDPAILTDERKSEAELERLQRIIEDRKQLARKADISYHLWGFYKSQFRTYGRASDEGTVQDGEWYDVTILRASDRNGRNEFEFELKGARYRFVDDEESQGWRENLKFFSLFLYDDSGRCLIEIPVKMRVDRNGRHYVITSDGPKAFIPGKWVNDFINVKLKQQSLRNQEIREQKHQERLWEIEDLKDRFGLRE